ncbi:MAG: DUF4430 domain-containing protein [Candidatus Lokiarchaeota archaeon]|nr:DUF4430 domain-containing protein [Candidatus Lokiarchaeota archaeon]
MNKKSLKYLIIIILAIVSFSTLIIVNYLVTNNPSATQNPGLKEEVNGISLRIDFKTNEDLNWFDFSLKNHETTVFHALDLWCDVIYKGSINTVIYVEAINGVYGNGWVFSVNGSQPPVASDDYALNDNDFIVWKEL